MDTKHLESIAEEYISYRLQRAGVLVAKPKFDVHGTDLLAFSDMRDGVKFCRVQCKGRSIAHSKSDIKIPIDYVTPGFVVALHLDLGDKQLAYLFFATDIRRWRKNSNNEFRLSLVSTTVEENLRTHLLDDNKMDVMKSVIANAEVAQEYGQLVRGSGAAQVSLTVSSRGNGTSRSKKHA